MDRDIPNCYDPIYQAERREADLESFFCRMPVCICCNDRILPNRLYHQFKGVTICSRCMEVLTESTEILE